MKFTIDGRLHDMRPEDVREAGAEFMQLVEERGVFLLPDGRPMGKVPIERLWRRIRGEGDAIRDRIDFLDGGAETIVPFIPGLQNWGTVPMLIGQPKAGRSTLVADYAATLMTPGRKFLDHFEAADLSLDERYRGAERRPDAVRVTIINVENHPAAFLDAVTKAMGTDDPRLMPDIIDLPSLGGPREFDLTEPSIYKGWRDYLMSCFECDGTDFLSPSVLVVDGLTAILSAAGKGPEHYTFLYAAIRDLMREIDTPTGLVTAHSTYKGDHALGGTESVTGPDGIWRLLKDSRGRRTFGVTEPRLGDPEVKMAPLTFDGRLRLQPVSGRSGTSSKTPAVRQPPVRDVVLDFVKAHGNGPSQREVREGVAGNNTEIDRVLDELVSDESIEKRPRMAKGGGFSYWTT